ncbi:hypothetical protein HanPI659440_Chr11g0418721 [Helianthus annuus]|nr:hypothetical protein HanPI659440_Chr11g0418721 [Helianthus annuus]
MPPTYLNLLTMFCLAGNDQIEVYSVNLSFHQQFSEELLKTILDYALSHNVQKLTVECFLNGHIVFPLDLFRSRSLKYLRLSGSPAGPGNGNCIIFESTWELPALTTLRLDYILVDDKLQDDDTGISLFSKCATLKNLTINFFAVLESCNFTVCHSGLSNGQFTLNFINVVAPQLKNLTLRSCYVEHMITTPNLVSLLFQSAHLLQFSTELHSLEKVDLRVYFADLWSGSRIAGLLQQLHNVKFLTLNLELVEPFTSYMESISLQPSPFSKLNSLKIYPVYVPSDDDAHMKITMSTKVLSYLLDGSPGATFKMISYEEVKEQQQKARAFENAVAAKNLMVDLQEMLEKEKADIDAQTDRGKTPMECQEAAEQGKAPVEKVQLQFKRKMAQMRSSWEEVGVQIDRGRTKSCRIVSQLREIEVLLLKDLPVSKRDELQACFSRIPAEVDTVVKKILHHLSDRFIELATTYHT